MLHLVKTDRIYSPEIISVMTAAFDRVCESLSTRINGNEAVKQRVASIILQHVDDGERSPERLAEIAFCELAGIDRSAGKAVGVLGVQRVSYPTKLARKEPS